MQEPRLWPGLFFDSLFSLPDWVELIGKAYLVWNELVRWFGGLTSFFAGFWGEHFWDWAPLVCCECKSNDKNGEFCG